MIKRLVYTVLNSIGVFKVFKWIVTFIVEFAVTVLRIFRYCLSVKPRYSR